jgi:hypothetical protein
MPVVLEMHYEDGTQEELRIPAEVWRNNAGEVGKLVMTPKTIASIVLDPHLETADVLLENNYFPRRPIEERIQLGNRPDRKNPMQEAREATEAGSEAPRGN